MDRVMVEKSIAGIGLAVLFACLYGCGQVGKEVTGYITTSDRVFDLREDTLSFTDADVPGSVMTISPDTTVRYQTMDGFGAAITGATCFNLSLMPEKVRRQFLDETFSPILELAGSYEFTDATTLNVTYRSGAVFSDGSALQSGDILASFEAAKDSPIYSGTLSGIRSASAGAGSTIVFELAYANPNAASLLTFPILKASEIDSDLPLGSGRYAFDEDDSGNITLVQNTKKENFEPFIQSIRLVNIASSESIANGISIDNIDYAFFSLDDEDAKSIKSQTKQVNINNLVYLGFNTASSSIMSNAALRQAVSLAISRDTIAKSAYHGYALAATSIFNPACTLAEVSAIFAEDSNASAAQQAITQSGADLNKNTVRLIVNRENASRTAAATVIETALEAVGFTVDVRQLSYSDYTQALEKGQYELYLGETKLSDDMCLYPFFQKDGTLHYGINENGASAKAYAIS